MSGRFSLVVSTVSLLIAVQLLPAQDANSRRLTAQQFHLRAQERTGVLVPMYIYPANIHTNAAFNRLIDMKRRFETVPMWVIVNPASGPGRQVDANYTKAIDRLNGAGCVVLAYVSTSYAKRPIADVKADMDQWLRLYPRIHGSFFDEMINEDTEKATTYQSTLNEYAASVGCWPTVANPGTDTPERYFAKNCADVIVVHEAREWPKEVRLKGDYFGGYSDYPPFTRAVLVYSQPQLDVESLKMIRKYCRWVYITEDQYEPGDPKADNPWDSLSKHLESICQELSR